MGKRLMAANEVSKAALLRRLTVGAGVVIWLFVASICHGQSLDPQKPSPLSAGTNKGNIDNFSGGHYYYFWAERGHIDIRMAFKEMGIFGAPLRQALSFDFFDESGNLLSHNAVVSSANLEQITTNGNFDSRRKLVLAITARKGLVRLGGYYEVEITGAADFEGSAGATAGVKPQGTELVRPGVQLVQPGVTLVSPPKGQHEGTTPVMGKEQQAAAATGKDTTPKEQETNVRTAETKPTIPSDAAPTGPAPAASATHGWLGVRIQAVTDEIAESLGLDKTRGALIASVTEKGPAEAAGVQRGDVVLSFDTRDVANMQRLPELVAATPPGKTVPIAIWRKQKESTIQVKIGILDETDQNRLNAQNVPKSSPKNDVTFIKALGIGLSGITADLKEEFSLPSSATGVVVVEVANDSPAAAKQLRSGDRIVEAAQEKVNSPGDVGSKVDQAKKSGRKSILLLLERQGDLRFTALHLD
jgi:membrane-associated protease RseP (regulator of RpoE activity)